MGMKRKKKYRPEFWIDLRIRVDKLSFIPWATVALLQEFNKDVLAPVMLPSVPSEHFWVGTVPWAWSGPPWVEPWLLAGNLYIKAFAFSHKGGGTTLPVSCNYPKVTTYLPELFVTFPTLSSSAVLWFIPKSFLLGYLAAFPHSSKPEGPFWSQPSELTSFWVIYLHAWDHWWHQWVCSIESQFGFYLEDVQNINVVRCVGQFLIQRGKCCR